MTLKETATFSFVSLGCARTLVDTESMVDKLQQAGFQLTAEGTGERVTLLNTCSFIQSAIDETEANIRAFISRKLEGHIQYLAVVGCYPSRFKKADLEAKFPEVDLWLTTKEEHKIQKALTELVFQRKFQPETHVKPYAKLTPSHYSYLKISEGCNNWCTFCTIPKIRGVHNSYSIPRIVDDAKKQIDFGAKELIIIAEDTTAWGEDIYGEPSLGMLLKSLVKLPVDWIRNMYIYPSRVDDDLIQLIKNEDKICNYMDMPVQHINSRLLERMRRQHDKAYLEDLMTQLFAEIPDFTWRTTFILGFPGETENDVDELIEFIERYPVTQLGCFPYSEEAETRSARYGDKVPAEVIQDRISRVMKRQYDLVQERACKALETRLQVLYEGNGWARSYREAPDVDGRIKIEGDLAQLTAGQFYTAEINGFNGYDLNAQIG